MPAARWGARERDGLAGRCMRQRGISGDDRDRAQVAPANSRAACCVPVKCQYKSTHRGLHIPGLTRWILPSKRAARRQRARGAGAAGNPTTSFKVGNLLVCKSYRRRVPEQAFPTHVPGKLTDAAGHDVSSWGQRGQRWRQRKQQQRARTRLGGAAAIAFASSHHGRAAAARAKNTCSRLVWLTLYSNTPAWDLRRREGRGWAGGTVGPRRLAQVAPGVGHPGRVR